MSEYRKQNETFHKGYLPNWSYELFSAYKRYPNYPSTYVLKDLKDEIVAGRFYDADLQKWRKHRATSGKGEKF